MSTSRRTYDTDLLTVRQIYAFNPNDSFISSGRVLATLGNGETSWVEPSTLNIFPAFNRVIGNGATMIADNSSTNTLTLSTLDGLGMVTNVGQKRVSLFSKAFTQFDVSGGNTLYGYSYNTVTPTVKFVGKSGINISANPNTNVLEFQGVPFSISTGVYAYNQVKVIPSSSNLDTSIPGSILTAPSFDSRLNVIGLNDIILSTNITSNAFTITISSFTSADYLAISTLANSNVSTVSSLFYDNVKIGQATSSLVDFTSNISTGINSNINYMNTYFTTFYTSLNYFSNVSTGQQAKINSKINFTSSISFPEQGLSQIGLNDAGTLQFSTASFSLGSMISNINLGASLEIRESLGLIFDSNTTVDKNNIYTVSSFITVNDTFLPSTVFTKPWMAPNDTASNLLTDTVFMTVDPNTMIINGANATYKIVHRIPNYTLASDIVSNKISQINGVSLRLYKS